MPRLNMVSTTNEINNSQVNQNIFNYIEVSHNNLTEDSY